jgi:GYF domain 2
MNWYYALGGQQLGPVDDAQFDALIAAGTITPDTLVWREGMPNWLPLREARPAASAPGVPPVVGLPPVVGAGSPGANEIVCAECGKAFTRDNAIQYGTSWVCATCKPAFVQKLKEGAATGGGAYAGYSAPVDPETLVQQIRERGYEVDIGSCIGRAWELTKSNFWLVVGTTFLVLLASGAAGSIPLIGYCTGPILQGPLMGGLYWFYLKLARGQEAGVNDGFSGFSSQFMQLALTSVVTTLFMYIWMVPAFVSMFALRSRQPSDFPVATIVLFVAAVPFMVYLGTAWIFALPLVVDKKFGFWDAMNVSRRVVNRKWFTVFALLLVAGLLQILGIIALCIGIFVTMTILHGAIVYAYEDIFNPRPSTVL